MAVFGTSARAERLAAASVLVSFGVFACGDASELEPIAGQTVQPLAWAAYPKALQDDAPRDGDFMGTAVALRGDIAVVGVPGADSGDQDPNEDSGAVDVFSFDKGVWAGPVKLRAPQVWTGAQVGWSVATDGTTVVAGAPFENPSPSLDLSDSGAAYAFSRDGSGEWIGVPVGSSQGPNSLFGFTVAVSGDQLLVGAPNFEGPEQVVAFKKSGAAWLPDGLLKPPTAVTGQVRFAEALALDGNTALVGASGEDDFAGAVYAFQYDGGGWVHKARLVADDAEAGDSFGYAIALRGTLAVVGATAKSGGLGAAYVFRQNASGDWKQDAQKLVAKSGVPYEGFAEALAIGPNIIWVGVSRRGGIGAVVPFSSSGPAWIEGDPLSVSDALDEQEIGLSLASSGRNLLIGAPGTNSSQGKAYVAELENGEECVLDQDCYSGHCVEHVCCNTACAGLCNSCAKERKANGASGTCGPTSKLLGPRDSACPIDNATSCGLTGLCDGNGGCAYEAKGVACSKPTCVGGDAQPASVCDGKGQCVATTLKDCGSYLCLDGACQVACTMQVDCDTDAYCGSAGTCLPKRSIASRCLANLECESGACVDGVCCDRACDGQCESCAEPKAVGTCGVIAGTPRGDRLACADAGGDNPCADLSCDGHDGQHCLARPGRAVRCATSSCVEGLARAEAYCDGNGACETQATLDCGAYACGATSCLTACETNRDCADGSYCEAGECLHGPHCSADNAEVVVSAEERSSCAPYACLDGACLQACAATSQCAPGFFCGSGTCLESSQAIASRADATSQGCACSMPSRNPQPAGWGWLAAASAAFALRSRRSRIS